MSPQPNSSGSVDAGRAVQIELRGLGKRYGEVVGVSPTNLQIIQGEFFSLLGPSGCGKSTILKLIAGFEVPSEGEVRVAGRAMAGIPPERRNVGFVFQNYALFPHMSVFENVDFGLRARGVPTSESRDRVHAALDLVELTGFGKRRPNQLSGGQQQRVALARALVIEPDVLLLDEPLGALDRKLRQAMQINLIELQKQLGVTTVFVTHDQEEALTMSDRIGVMSTRRQTIEQVGTPRQIYEHPCSVLVSDFIGQTNLWEEQIVDAGDDPLALTERGFRVVRSPVTAAASTVVVSLRPERIRIVAEDFIVGASENTLDGRVREVVFIGELILYLIETELEITMQVKVLNSEDNVLFKRGDSVTLAWQAESMLALPGA